MAAMGLPQRCQGLLVGCLGGLQLLGPMGFHLLKLELNRLDLLLDLAAYSGLAARLASMLDNMLCRSAALLSYLRWIAPTSCS